MKKERSFLPFAALILLSIVAVFLPAVPTTIVTEGLVAGDIAWMLTATAMVLLMTPGLAYFYGGMVNAKNVISTMLQSFVAMGIISVLWVTVGFSLAFGESIGGLIGNPSTFFLFNGVLDGKPWSLAATIPLALFAFFQLKFAIITPALITGSFSERIRFKSYVLFIILFSIFIYAPLAHWTWHPDGILFKLGVLDFAGGTVVHMSAGWAALAGALYLGKRKDSELTPANVPFVMLGTGLLWFGWFGFNAGSAVGASALAVTAFATTNTASAAAGLSWIFFDALRGKKPSALGFCIGAVVGLVAITPAAGFVTVPHSIFIGTIAAVISNLVAHWKTKTSLDDTLDVFPCHGVGGMVGMLMTGIFASKGINSALVDEGLFFGGTTLFVNHLIALVGVSLFAFVASFILLKVTDLISPLRVTSEEEAEGLDKSQHDEVLI
jgi:Amt family ammonium transporter